VGVVVSRGTLALVAIDEIDTDPVVGARFGGTLVNVGLTMCTGKASRTLAGVLVDAVLTLSPVGTWVTVAFVDVVLAVDAGSSCRTLTLVPIEEVLTSASVDAGCRHTLVDLSVAQGASVTRGTVAGEGVVTVPTPTVLARGGEAVVYVRLTDFTGEAWLADALVAVDGVVAETSVEAGFVEAVVNVDLTVGACESFVAVAVVVSDPVVTQAMFARVAGALVDVNLAILSGETWAKEREIISLVS